MIMRNIVYTIVLIILGLIIFSEVPTEVKEETNRILFSTPVIYIIMFICLILAIVFFWILIRVQIPAVVGGKKGIKESEENVRRFKNFFNKFIFWRKK